MHTHVPLHASLNDGRTLDAVTHDHPVLLLFLRQFGCIFCREAVADLSRLQPALRARGIEVVLVHQGTPQQADVFFAEHAGGNFSRIADPDRSLYRAFDLKRVGPLNAFGIPMWLRSFDVTRQGHSLGKLVGDGWQMPGCFIVHQEKILSSFPYDMVADRPDYLAFVDSALTRDLSQLGLLLPDGSVRDQATLQSDERRLPPHLSLWARQTLHEKPLLLLVGGNGSLPERFQPLMEALRDRYAISVVELAGQGYRQDAPVPDSFDGFVADLARELLARAQTLKAAGANGPLFLFGHGIGGLFLAHAVRVLSKRNRSDALSAPFTPAGLVLLSPVGAKLPRRRFPSLMKLPGVRPLARYLLGRSTLGSLLSRRLLPPPRPTLASQEVPSQVSAQDRLNFARGYRMARSFAALFDVVDPLTALDGLDAITCPVVLMWGAHDPVLSLKHLPAWAELFSRASVRAHVLPARGHYPYLEDPAGFASALTESLEGVIPRPAFFTEARQFNPRSKGGRLIALRRAELPCPDGLLIPADADDFSIRQLLARLPDDLTWAVRSSASLEDQLDTTGAGRFLTRLNVATAELLKSLAEVRGSLTLLGNKGSTAVMDVVIQPMVPRTVGGVAWARPLGADIELMEGGAEGVVEGREGVIRLSLSHLGAPWQNLPDRLPGGLTAQKLREELLPLLERCRQVFEVPGLDIEWCFHPEGGFTLLQARPLVAGLAPRRLLSSANVAEIIPPSPSPLLVDSATAAAPRLPRYYARFDARLVDLQEPFTCTENGRYFINVDLFARIFDVWGLPRQLVTRQVGGILPGSRLKPLAFLRSLPVFWRLLTDQREVSARSQAHLELLRARLLAAHDLPELLEWFEQAYEQVVTGNLRIAGVMALLIPLFRRGPTTVTHLYTEELKRLGQSHPEWLEKWGHRGVYESDPAWPRGDHPALNEHPRDFLPDPLMSLPGWRRRLPWLHPRHMQAHREWFRDASMRLWSAFRARMRGVAQQAVAEGTLPDEEAIFSLGRRELLLPRSEWSLALSVNRRAPVDLPPPLFWSDSLEAFDPSDADPSDADPSASHIEPLGSSRGASSVVIVRGGSVEGFALVARTPLEAQRLLRRVPQSPILVAPAVGPGWEPIFQKVVGVVTELGGRLSHAAIHLGEDAAYRIPVIFNLKGVTQQVKTGDPVKLEAPPGRLRSLKPPSAST